MSILIGILTVIEVIVCLLLILIILMQRPRQEGLGAAFGGGVTDQMFGAQTTNVLQKFTGYLAGALFLLTLVLAILTTQQQRNKSAEGKKIFEAPPPASAPVTPPAPAAAIPPAPAAAIPPAPGAASAASAPVAVPSGDGKTISVTKQPNATVVVKQSDGKAAPKPAEAPAKPEAKSDGKAAPAPASAPQLKLQSAPPAPAPKSAAPPSPATAPTPSPAPADKPAAAPATPAAPATGSAPAPAPAKQP